MNNTQTQQYNHQQGHMFWHVSLLVLGIVSLFVWSVLMSYQSSVIVYEINETEEKNEILSEEIAQHETEYYVATQDYVEGGNISHTGSLVAYSTRDSNVRYAQVGGAVYSMLTTY